MNNQKEISAKWPLSPRDLSKNSSILMQLFCTGNVDSEDELRVYSEDDGDNSTSSPMTGSKISHISLQLFWLSNVDLKVDLKHQTNCELDDDTSPWPFPA